MSFDAFIFAQESFWSQNFDVLIFLLRKPNSSNWNQNRAPRGHKIFFSLSTQKTKHVFFKASFHIHSLKKSLFFNCFVFDGGLSSKIIKALEAIKSHEKTWKSSAEKPQTDIIASHTHFELSSREIIAFSHAT